MREVKNNPTVSVIITTYNRAQLVSRALQSALNQTYGDFEIIVVDDASTDNTMEVLGRFEDKRIRYLRREKNGGNSASRNTGIQAAKGDYIALLDSDDEWFPEKLQKQVNKFIESGEGVGLIYTGFLYVSQKTGEILGQVIPTFRGNVYANLFMKGCFLANSSAFIKKTCFEKVGFFDEDLRSCVDWDMWIRLSKYFEFDFVPDILTKFYFHENQVSSNLNMRVLGTERLIRKHKDDFSQFPSRFALYLKRIGIFFFLSGNGIKGRQYLWDSIRRYPFQRSAYIYLLLSILPATIHKAILKRHYVRKVGGVEFYK